LSLVLPKQRGDNREDGIQEILDLMDIPSVDPHIQLKTGEKAGHVTEEWNSFQEELKELHLSFLEAASILVKEAKAELLRELTSEAQGLNQRLRQVYNKAQMSIQTIKKATTKDKAKQLLKNFEELLFKSKMNKEAKKETKSRWKQVKAQLMEEFGLLEKFFEKELQNLSRWGKIFSQVEHHVAHKEHHPVLKCGSCGKQLTLKEFLHHYPNVVLDEEDWWTDTELENFYLGWPEWANCYGVKCPVCKSTNWKEVDYVSWEEEHVLEDQALETDQMEEQAAMIV